MSSSREKKSARRHTRFTALLVALLCQLNPGMVKGDSISSSQLADALERAKRATVGILNEVGEAKDTDRQTRFSIRGTGFHLRDGYIVTARHAVERNEMGQKVAPKRISVMTTDLHELPAELQGDSAYMDVVVYRIAEKHRAALVATAAFAEADVAPGDQVFTVGYPLGWGPAIAFGRIGNINTFLQTVDTRLLQADLSVCSGNSGGGLFNNAGEIVGVMHAILQTEKESEEAHCSRFAFAVPGRLAHRIVNAALEGKPLTFSRLGIHMMAVKVETRWRIAVRDVSEPAKSAGIQKTDILLAIDGTDIIDAAQLKNYLIERTTPGQRIMLRVLRQDIELTLPITLGGG